MRQVDSCTRSELCRSGHERVVGPQPRSLKGERFDLLLFGGYLKLLQTDPYCSVRRIALVFRDDATLPLALGITLLRTIGQKLWESGFPCSTESINYRMTLDMWSARRGILSHMGQIC